MSNGESRHPGPVVIGLDERPIGDQRAQFDSRPTPATDLRLGRLRAQGAKFWMATWPADTNRSWASYVSTRQTCRDRPRCNGRATETS